MLMNMFEKCHIAPSYRWRVHQSWATSMTLLGRFASWQWEAQVLSDNGLCQGSSGCIRGFSAVWAFPVREHTL